LIGGLKISIILLEKIILLVLLEFIMTDGKIVGLQHGTVSMGAIMHKYLPYIDMDLNLPELAIKERARIEQELPHYATALQLNVNEPEDNDFDDDFDDDL